MFKPCFLLLAALACSAWLVLLVSEEQALASPLSNVFRCNSGQTIGQKLVCDRTVDCVDGSDEEECPTDAYQFQSPPTTSSEPNSLQTQAYTSPPVTTHGPRFATWNFILIGALGFLTLAVGVACVVYLLIGKCKEKKSAIVEPEPEADTRHGPCESDRLLPEPMPLEVPNPEYGQPGAHPGISPIIRLVPGSELINPAHFRNKAAARTRAPPSS